MFGLMKESFVKKVEKQYVAREVDVCPGDTVEVHLRITEAGKERIQVFEGVVLSVRGTGLGKTVTVRKMSHGVGIEKIFPISSPMIKKIDIIERGNVRRAKLFYMRNKVGKRSLDVNQEEGFEGIMEVESDGGEADSGGEEGTRSGEETSAKDEDKSDAATDELEETKDIPEGKKTSRKSSTQEEASSEKVEQKDEISAAGDDISSKGAKSGEKSD